jgi:hypothetical protein
VVFSFNAGAPLAAPPGATRAGALSVVTQDGYLHALRPDGGYRFSYSFRGRPLGTPVETPEGLIVAAAEPNRLYTLDADGDLVWVSTVVGGLATGPTLDGEGRIWVGTEARTLLAFSPRGGGVGFGRTGPPPLSAPVAIPPGAAAIGAADGTVRIAGGPSGLMGEPGSDAVHELFLTPHGLFAVGNAGLIEFDHEGLVERWRRTMVRRLVCAEPALVAVEGETLRWLSPRGEPRRALPLPAPAAAPAVCLPGGAIVMARDRSLVRLETNGRVSERSIPGGPLLSLTRVAPSTLVVSYRTGRVLALRE